MSLINDLQWRYATKKMNGQKVPQEKVDYILEATRLTASSSGLQPYKVLVVTNKELLEQIKVIANGQAQITDCSHLLIFASWDNYTTENISKVFANVNKERGLPEDNMSAYKDMLLNVYTPRAEELNHAHTARQAYIAVGTALAAAAEQKVDATPMEGFNAPALDELLNLKEKGLHSLVLLPLGYRDTENDWLANLKKVRTPQADFITELN